MRTWLLRNERNLAGMEVSVRVAHSAFNRYVRDHEAPIDREISFSTFARNYLRMRTAGLLKNWPLTRGRGDDWRQAFMPFALEGIS